MANINFLNRGILDHGAIGQLAKVIKQTGGSKPFVVTDKGIRAVGILDTVLANLGGEPAAVYDETLANPEEEQAEAAAAAYREAGADCIIAVGGGSSIDLAKAVGIMVSHPGEFASYGSSVRGKIGKVPPFIAIPTTAGTGSEVSVGSVITMRAGFKEVFNSRTLVPDVAICDPDLTIGLPPILTAATGMDAVTHCIEAICSPLANPVADAIGLDGLERAVGWGMLKRAVKDGTDKEARYNMMLASYEGAMAFMKGLGAVHALSHAAGRLKEIRPHHGTLNAIWLPHVLRDNADAPGMDTAYARIRRAMHLPEGGDIAAAIEALNADIGLPSTLKEMGFAAEHGPGVAEYATKDGSGYTNPKKHSEDDYLRLYNAALG